MEKIIAVEYDESFLELSWKWLNDPEIKRLTDTPVFTKSEQKKWFESLPFRKDYFVWGICFKKEKIGAFGMKNISKKSAEYFGYIGLKTLWGKGYGQEILCLAVEKAKELEIEEVWLKVLIENNIAIKSYKKFGFREFKREGSHILMKVMV